MGPAPALGAEAGSDLFGEMSEEVAPNISDWLMEETGGLDDSGQVVGIAASTESLYYTEKDGVQKNLQMVFKNCVPVSQLRELIGG